MNKKTVLEEEMAVSPEKWLFSDKVQKMETSIIREILKISSQPGVISLAGGYPSPDMFPIEDLKQAAAEAVDEFKATSLQYSFSMGVPQMRESLAKRETELGIPTKMENILITSGSQQGLDILGRAFLEPGDYVLCESPTYVGAMQAFNYYDCRYAPIDMDQDGMIIDQVEKAIEKYNPKFIYSVPTFQNPTGITMTVDRRKALVEIASKHNIPLIDDNPYGEIRFTGAPVPTLKQIGGDAVISLGTFSKIVAPGFRIGWMNCSEKIIHLFEKMKQGSDLHTGSYAQFVLHKYLESGKLPEHITRLIANYGEKRNRMIEEIENNFPEEITFTRPEGGLFLWCKLPEGMSASKLLNEAVKEKVTYVYGYPFFPDGKDDQTFRLNFSNASPDTISTAIQRLAIVFGKNMP